MRPGKGGKGGKSNDSQNAGANNPPKRKRNNEESLNDSLLDMPEKIKNLEGELFDVKNTLQKYQEEMKKLSDSNASLKEELQQERLFSRTLSEDNNSLAQYTRKWNLRVFNVKDTDRNEDANKSEQLILHIFKHNLGLDWITHGDIEIAHRTGLFSEDTPRAIIVRFFSRKIKNAVIQTRKKLKGSKISIAEDLTPKNLRRLYEIKQLQCVFLAWGYDGKLFAKNSPDGRPREIKPTDILSENLFESHRNNTDSRHHQRTNYQQKLSANGKDVRAQHQQLNRQHPQKPHQHQQQQVTQKNLQGQHPQQHNHQQHQLEGQQKLQQEQQQQQNQQHQQEHQTQQKLQLQQNQQQQKQGEPDHRQGQHRHHGQQQQQQQQQQAASQESPEQSGGSEDAHSTPNSDTNIKQTVDVTHQSLDIATVMETANSDSVPTPLHTSSPVTMDVTDRLQQMAGLPVSQSKT